MYDDPFIRNKDKRVIYQPELKFLSINNNDCHIWGKCIKNEIYKKAISNFYQKRDITYICITEDDIMVFMLFSTAKSFFFLPIYGLFHLISNNTASFTLPKDHLVFSKIYYSDFIFDFSGNNTEEKQYAVKIAINSQKYILSKNLSFNEENKKYLQKVLKKMLQCFYISNKNKILLKNIFNY